MDRERSYKRPERKQEKRPALQREHQIERERKRAPEWAKNAAFMLCAVALAVTVKALWPVATDEDERVDPAKQVELSQTLKQALPLTLAVTKNAAETTQAIKALQLSDADAEQLAQDVQQERVSMAWVELWDSEFADGDIVRVESSGFVTDVTLAKAPTVLALPVTAGSPLRITTVFGGHDDDAQVATVGVSTKGGTVFLPYLPVAQSITLPLR